MQSSFESNYRKTGRKIKELNEGVLCIFSRENMVLEVTIRTIFLKRLFVIFHKWQRFTIFHGNSYFHIIPDNWAGPDLYDLLYFYLRLIRPDWTLLPLLLFEHGALEVVEETLKVKLRIVRLGCLLVELLGRRRGRLEYIRTFLKINISKIVEFKTFVSPRDGWDIVKSFKNLYAIVVRFFS